MILPLLEDQLAAELAKVAAFERALHKPERMRRGGCVSPLDAARQNRGHALGVEVWAGAALVGVAAVAASRLLYDGVVQLRLRDDDDEYLGGEDASPALDAFVANVTGSLARRGLMEGATFVFTTDNGGNLRGSGNNWPLRELPRAEISVAHFVWGFSERRCM